MSCWIYLDTMPTSNFQPIRLLDLDCYNKFTYLMANSADPDQLASSEANWSGSTLFAKQDISGFSKTRVNRENLHFILLQWNLYIILVFIKYFKFFIYIKTNVSFLNRRLSYQKRHKEYLTRLTFSKQMYINLICTNQINTTTVLPSLLEKRQAGISSTGNIYSWDLNFQTLDL